MIEKFMEIYSKWDPFNQLIFASVLVLMGFVLVVLGSIWLLFVARMMGEWIAVWVRGYPVSKTTTPSHMGHHFREEVRLMNEEAEYQAALARKLMSTVQPQVPSLPPSSNGKVAGGSTHATGSCPHPLNTTGHCLNPSPPCINSSQCSFHVEMQRKPDDAGGSSGNVPRPKTEDAACTVSDS